MPHTLTANKALKNNKTDQNKNHDMAASSLIFPLAALLHKAPRPSPSLSKGRTARQVERNPSIPLPPHSSPPHCRHLSRGITSARLSPPREKKIQVPRRHDSQLRRCRLASSRKLLRVIAVFPSQVAERTGPPPPPRRRPETEELRLANPRWAPPGRRRPAPPRCGSQRERTAAATRWRGRPTDRSPPPRCSRC